MADKKLKKEINAFFRAEEISLKLELCSEDHKLDIRKSLSAPHYHKKEQEESDNFKLYNVIRPPNWGKVKRKRKIGPDNKSTTIEPKIDSMLDKFAELID